MDASPSSFQLDEVVSITPAGRAIVYDVQIERTENFIANGLVSHNTRWHFDDLIGRLIDEQGRGGDKWEVVNFPAISDGGEALWPEKFDIPALQQIREVIGARAWSALYQQTPMLEEGAFFKREWFDVVDAAPIYLPWVRYWDLAASVKTSGDFTASAKCAIDEEGTLWIADVMRGKWEWPDAHKKMWSAFVAEKRNTYQVVEEALHGIAALQQLRREPELAGVSFRGWRVDRDKQQRAMPWAARAEAGKVKVLRGAWNAAFFEEIGQFPYGKHDDQVDAVSGAVAVISANVNKQRAGLRSIVISSKPDNWRPMAVRR